MGIIIRDVSYTYLPGTSFAREALQGIQMTISKGEFVGLIGPTGSGKSTLVQVMAGLLTPTTGEIFIGADRCPPSYERVGLVFQYPEHQLFAESVWEDIAYGPHNLGLSQSEIEERVKDAAQTVGLAEEWLTRSPFQLSGGQMRRVALAGVLAMQPAVLILDEPTAGLDPAGRDELLHTLDSLRRERETTIVLVTHQMDELAGLADQLFVMNHGRLVLSGPPAKVFAAGEQLTEIGLDIPKITQLIRKLNQKLTPPLPLDLFTSEALAAALAERWLRRKSP